LKEPKCALKEILQTYKEVFQALEGIPPKRKVEHETQLLLDSPLPNVGLYRQSILESDEVKKQWQDSLEQGVLRPNTSPLSIFKHSMHSILDLKNTSK
jgi:hypothetical protein